MNSSTFYILYINLFHNLTPQSMSYGLHHLYHLSIILPLYLFINETK